MTKKDQELIAGVIAEQVRRHKSKAMNIVDRRCVAALRTMADELATTFEVSNPRFDGARFFKACGF